jgi:filamentous hemagglutinin family protein
MSNALIKLSLRTLALSSALCGWRLLQNAAVANPTGGTVAQGGATFHNSGPVETITTSGNTAINWQSFNIGAGETTTFVEPTSSSIVWNTIGGLSPSQILGSLNANGYVVLQNQYGFYVGGQAAITAHGLIMTTAGGAVPNLASGGAWEFDAPPPSAKIINYGQINISGGGSAFLLASDIENDGTICAAGGKIGLYAGEEVLVSSAPDGRGLSSVVTLPQGSVDNNGKLIADAGSIVAQAQTVNQNGLVQANSVREVNGTIELLASDSVNVGANSVISAKGDATGVSGGGSVTIKSGNTFADQAGSVIDISGGAEGGNGGQAEISAPQMSAINSSINGQAVNGFVSGELGIDPLNIVLASASSDPNAQYSGTVNANDTPAAGTLTLNVSDFSSTLSQINLAAINNITLNTAWNLANAAGPATLTLTAGNSIVLNNNAAINAGNNWNVNLNAGSGFVPSGTQTAPAAGSITSPSYGIYLGNSAYIQTKNGNIDATALNEVIIASGSSAGNNGIRTVGEGVVNGINIPGGNITVVATDGSVNTGGNLAGYVFAPAASLRNNAPPYYTVSPTAGGISTIDGGNVNITAGGNVTSYLPSQVNYNNSSSRSDAGTGAFGAQAGNVTIVAGGNVSGNYVVANGIGSVTAGGNLGVPGSSGNQNQGFALSLIDGNWSVYAPHGSIYLDDVINPNGVFNDNTRSGYTGYHNFDYGATASVLLDAANSVEITGSSYLPLAVASDSFSSSPGTTVPILLPPSLTVDAGAGGFVLDTSVILFPSSDQNLNVTTINGGNFMASAGSSTPLNLEMSGSANTQWSPGSGNFEPNDQAATPNEINNPNPVEISINGNMENIDLYTTKETEITVKGNMVNSGFSGQNLHATDTTTIAVTGDIINSPLYSFADLSSVITSANPGNASAWDSVFNLAINPAELTALENLNVNSSTVINAEASAGGLIGYLNASGYLLFPNPQNTVTLGINPGFVYDSNPASLQLGFKGNMSSLLSANQIADLENGSFTVLRVSSTGTPLVDANGKLQTATYNFSAAPQISTLYQESKGLSSSTTPGLGYQIGGPGQFNVTAASLSLGNSSGILSLGFGDGSVFQGIDYASLEGVSGVLASGGAAVNVNVAGNISMATSTIGSFDGGDVTVNSGGEIDLSQGNVVLPTSTAYGIYTSGHSDVHVTAQGTINIGSARIAAFNGGSVKVISNDGDVNAGVGANLALTVYGFYIGPNGPSWVEFGNPTSLAAIQADPSPYGSGVIAILEPAKYQTPGGMQVPGDIEIQTLNGNINSIFGGIRQFALNGVSGGSAIIDLIAGTHGVAPDADQGNINLGGPIIGQTVDLDYTGNFTGILIAQENANITGENFSGVLLAGGTANIAASGSVSGTVVGIGGINATGGGTVTANLVSENVSANGATTSTLATSSTGTSASSSAAQQATSSAQQQMAANSSNDSDNSDNKKKKPGLMQRIKRVTVILPKSS